MYRTCPNCHQRYQTILNRPEGDKRPIQVIFPFAPKYQREQLISGICSDKCWSEFIGNGQEEK